MYIYGNMALIVDRMTVVLGAIKHIIRYIKYFRKSYCYEMKRKSTVEAGMQATEDKIIRRRKDAICLPDN